MKPKTICVIDDDVEIRQFLTDLLKHEGYDVIAPENPYQALSFVYENRPDLILLDLRMPRIDGMALLPGLRAASSDTPVVVLTAHGNPQVFLQAFEKGACEVISKPFHPVDLICVVRRLVGDILPAK